MQRPMESRLERDDIAASQQMCSTFVETYWRIKEDQRLSISRLWSMVRRASAPEDTKGSQDRDSGQQHLGKIDAAYYSR